MQQAQLGAPDDEEVRNFSSSMGGGGVGQKKSKCQKRGIDP